MGIGSSKVDSGEYVNCCLDTAWCSKGRFSGVAGEVE
jgi:hypothetical protein